MYYKISKANFESELKLYKVLNDKSSGGIHEN